jgi:hypothetical protein
VTQTLDPRPAGFSQMLGWAIYLGVSWTWCIGMFLPVLLLRDLGTPAFFVFAIPNILGAAAMGWILKDAGQSHRITHHHESACVWFSLITILFHAFFAAWIIRRITGPMAGVSIAVVFWFLWMIFRAVPGGAIWAAIMTFVISLGSFGLLLAHGLLPKVAQPLLGAITTGRPIDAIWLAPVCLLGFGLCPYLDLTFHHAFQSMSKRNAIIAFAIGFVVIFGAMLAFTFCYSGWLASPFEHPRYPMLIDLLGAHLIVQTCFTVAAHVERIAPEVRKLTVQQVLAFTTAFVVVVLAGSLDRGPHRLYFPYHGLGVGEFTYRVFMVFYGLVFPAYVWLQVIPGKSDSANRWLAAAVILGVPMYWMGFIERKMIWLVPGVAVVLLARLAIRRQARPTP